MSIEVAAAPECCCPKVGRMDQKFSEGWKNMRGRRNGDRRQEPTKPSDLPAFEPWTKNEIESMRKELAAGRRIDLRMWK